MSSSSCLGNITLPLVLTTFYKFLYLYLAPTITNILWGRHQLFQSDITFQDVMSLLRPVRQCKGMSITLSACLSSSKKAPEEVHFFTSYVSDSCTPNHSNGLSGSVLPLSQPHWFWYDLKISMKKRIWHKRNEIGKRGEKATTKKKILLGSAAQREEPELWRIMTSPIFCHIKSIILALTLCTPDLQNAEASNC